MSLSTKDQVAPRRRNRVYGANEPPGARLSGLSLISNGTTISTNSNGSTATVTQDSYLKSKQPSEKKKRSRRRSDVGESKSEKPIPDTSIVAHNVDVFEFLVEESRREKVQLEKTQSEKGQSEKVKPEKSQPKNDCPEDHQPEATQLEVIQPEQIQPEKTRRDKTQLERPQPEMEMTGSQSFLQPKQEAQGSPDESDCEGYYRSQVSDSGISITNSAGDASIDTPSKPPLPTLIEEVGDFHHYPPSGADHYYSAEPPLVWGPVPIAAPFMPEPMPLSPASVRTYPYSQEYAYRGTPDPPSTGESSVTCLDSAPLVFRDRTNKRTQPPLMFRSFAKLNEKVLLQMQSNITDLEHELAVLDAKTVSAETNARYKKGDYTNTTSRHFTKDQSQRADLYQELHTSLEQYYEALASFHRINQLTSPCGMPDTIAFKSWLRHQILPTSKIASLVGDGSDMVRFGNSSKESSDQTLRVIAYGVFANICFPLLLFKLASGVLSRLIILSVTTVVATLMMERHRASVKVDLGDLHWHCIIGSAGVSLFAAMLF